MCQHRLGGHGGVFMRFDDEDRPLFPFGMENADNRRELHARAGDCGVLDIDRAHPFATRLDDVFLAVGEAHEAVLVYRGDIASVERSEEHTSELQSLMRISYAVFCLK